MIVTYDDLWRIAVMEAKKVNGNPITVFDPIGLILEKSLKNDFKYNHTPINSSTFASTGGDGVHYVLLHIDGQVTPLSPVIMVIPMMGEKGNVVVGSSLYEFLCLGCKFQYFALEQLVYQKSKTLLWISQAETDSEREKYLLSVLTQTFDLKPWDNVEERLAALQKDYMPLVELQFNED